MNDIWYYAEGDKPVGPLSHTDMIALLARVSNVRNILVWRDGFSSWVKVEDVPELAPYVTKPPPLSIFLPHLGQRAITAPTSSTFLTIILRYCFGFSGRFNRADFWIGYAVAFLMTMLSLVPYIRFPDNTAAATLAGLWCILWFISILAVATKRLHDLNQSGLVLMALVIVLVALPFAVPGQVASAIPGIGIILLGSIGGTKGTNRFGFDPSR